MKPDKELLDYKQIQLALLRMKPRSRLYEIVRKEMVRRKRWKQLPRGESFRVQAARRKL